MSPAAAIVVRPSVEQANIPALRDAYAKMHAFMSSDNRGLSYGPEYDGCNRYDCWHHAGTGAAQGTNTQQLYRYDLFLT